MFLGSENSKQGPEIPVLHVHCYGHWWILPSQTPILEMWTPSLGQMADHGEQDTETSGISTWYT